MSAIVEEKTPIKLSDILLNSVSGNSFKLIDMTADSFYLNRNIPFEDQQGAYVFSLELKPSIIELINKKIFSYKLTVSDPVSSGIISENVISFYEDFKNIMDIGEMDYQALIDEIKKPQTMIIDSRLDPDGEVSEGTPLRLQDTTSGEMLSYPDSSARLIESGIDPDDTAQLSMAKFPVSSTAYSLDGSGKTSVSEFRGKKSKSLLIRHIGERISLNDIRSEKLDGDASNIDTPQYLDHESSAARYDALTADSDSIDLGRQIQFITDYFDSKRIIEVPKSEVVSGGLRFSFTPIVTGPDGDDSDPSSTSLTDFEPTSEVVTIPVDSRVTNLIEPEVPPEIRITSNTPGRITYSVKRNDPTTNKIIVTIRHINVGKMTLAESIEDREIEHNFYGYTDDVSSEIVNGVINKQPYVVLITAQDISRNGEGLASRSAVVKSHPSETLQDYKTNYVSINAFLEPDGLVRVEVDQTTAHSATRIKICRENLTVPVSSPDRNKILTESLNPESSFVFTDDTAIPGKTYRYYAVSDYMNPIASTVSSVESVVSTCDSIIKVIKEKSNIYEINVVKKGPRTFRPTVSIKKSQAELIQQSLDGSGIDMSNFSSLVTTSQQLRKLAYFIVERLDRETGNREFMTVIQPFEEYTDTNPQSNTRYSYIFRLAVADPTASFVISNIVKSKETVDSKVVDEYIKTLTQGLTSSSGVLETADNFFEKTDEFSTIKAGITSQEVIHTITPNLQVTAPNMLLPTEVTEGYRGGSPSIKLNWEVGPKSDITKIDSFYVWCIYQGSATVMQTVNCSNSISKYSYVDTVYFNEIGEKEYYVVARYKDYTFGPKSGTIIRSKFAPVPIPMIQTMKVIPLVKKINPTPISFSSMVKTVAFGKGFFTG